MTDPANDPTTAPRQWAYDGDDVELFHTDAFTHVSDQRSVGELLFDVDRHARVLLMDVCEHDAAPLLHAWPTLISAAGSMWHALPAPLPQPLPQPMSPPPAEIRRAEPPTSCMDRLDVIGTGVSRRLTTKRWPGPTAPDGRLLEMADTLSRAADLTRRFGYHGPLSPAGRDDLEAARARLLHAVYVTTHAVSVALLQFGRTRHDLAAATPRPLASPNERIPYAVAPTTEWVRRIGAAESAAASYVNRRQFAPLLNKEHRADPASASRLNLALARWDIEAHRGLAGHSWPKNIVLVVRTQAFIAGSALTLLDAAAAHEQGYVPSRLVEAVAQSGAAWTDLGGRWDDLTPAHTHPADALLLAAGELRAAARELTQDGAGRATPHTIRTRPGAAEGLHALLAAMRHGDELAHVVDERSAAPGLSGHARVMSHRAQNDIAAGRVPIAVDSNIAWVSPLDIHAGRTVPAPVPVIAALKASSHTAVQAATAAGAITTATADVVLWPVPDDPARENLSRQRQPHLAGKARTTSVRPSGSVTTRSTGTSPPR
ncbi:hypothetical protein [Nocardioides okcheonensis]|uniref:hypothetical protein n=1 Tax=Nocardioides okcheonensis TaxID=2894081 RepID=UPI001E351A79|nr:hypothetical protein [Nocardioides okcheonensis]UFN45228.1 hypothetical protein LN652_03150 [Nocardioides okcheonensis]